MEIAYDTKKLAKTVADAKSIRANYGLNARKVKQRLDDLAAAETLADLSKLPPVRCHLLRAEFKDCYAVDIVHPHRIIFRPSHDPIPTLLDGGHDLAEITCITICAISTDYH